MGESSKEVVKCKDEETNVIPKTNPSPKCKAQIEPNDKEVSKPTMEQINVEIDGAKEGLSYEEQVLKWLLNEW